MYKAIVFFSNKGYDTYIRIYKELAEKYGGGKTDTHVENALFLSIWKDEKNAIMLQLSTNSEVTLTYVNIALLDEYEKKSKSEY